MRVKRGEMDRKQLRMKFFEKDLNITSLSKAIEVNKDTFYRRLRNQGKKLTLGDLKRLSLCLSLAIMAFVKLESGTTEQINTIVMSFGTLITYVLSEGFIDAKNIENKTEEE